MEVFGPGEVRAAGRGRRRADRGDRPARPTARCSCRPGRTCRPRWSGAAGPGDVVVTMGAPPISLMGDELLAALGARSERRRTQGRRWPAGAGVTGGWSGRTPTRCRPRCAGSWPGPGSAGCARRCPGRSRAGVAAGGRARWSGWCTARPCSASARCGWSGTELLTPAAGASRPRPYRCGTPLARVDLDAVRAPGAGAGRRWTGPRCPAAGRPRSWSRWSSGRRWRRCRPDRQFTLIDGEGVAYRTVTRQPAGLPLAELAAPGPADVEHPGGADRARGADRRAARAAGGDLGGRAGPDPAGAAQRTARSSGATIRRARRRRRWRRRCCSARATRSTSARPTVVTIR